MQEQYAELDEDSQELLSNNAVEREKLGSEIEAMRQRSVRSPLSACDCRCHRACTLSFSRRRGMYARVCTGAPGAVWPQHDAPKLFLCFVAGASAVLHDFIYIHVSSRMYMHVCHVMFHICLYKPPTYFTSRHVWYDMYAYAVYSFDSIPMLSVDLTHVSLS